jgi:very-short-patch-repair endonuclease
MKTEFAKTRTESGSSRTRGDDRPLSELVLVQHGVVSRRQLLGRGWTEEEIDWRLGNGRLHRVHAGVYAPAPPQLLSRSGRWMAAVLASGDGALLSHWSAAALWGFRPNGRSRIDIVSPRRGHSSRAICRHFSLVPEDERVVKDRIPATSVPRTTFDLAASADLDTVVEMIRESEYLHLWDRLSLPQLLERYPRKRGSRKVEAALRRISEEPSGRKRSQLERRFAPFLRLYALPLPRFNDWILLGPKRFQVDCHWPDQRLIVELDGWEGHSSRSAFQDDRSRDRRLHVAGYTVLHLTWNQLDDEAEAISSGLRSLLAKPTDRKR